MAAHAVVIGAAAVLCLSFSKPDEIVIPISVELVEPSAESEPAPAEAEPAPSKQPEQAEAQEQLEAQPEAIENLDNPEELEALEELESLDELDAPEILEEPETLEQLEKPTPSDHPAPSEPPTPVEATPAPTISAERAKVVSDPVALNKIVPVYPRLARRKGHEGSVVVEISITGDGAVSDANVMSSSGHRELDQAALEAVRNAKFSPATENGMSVSGRLRLTIEFKLEK